MAKVLVIRTSAFGDVAMLVPVIYSVAAKYPQDRFTVMTRQAFAPLFENLGFNINVLPLSLNQRHKGTLGMLKVLKMVVGKGYSHVADTHNVLRSNVIRSVLAMSFCKTAKIDKGRSEKRLMIEKKDTSVYLKSTIDRYYDVFAQLGFPAKNIFQNLFDFKPRDFSRLRSVITKKEESWIGIAPFAKHKGKIYPLEKTENIVAHLSKRENTKIFLFGAGSHELGIINQWNNKYSNIVLHNGKLNLDREILLISYLDVMLSMDSANMHLASLVEVPVVSVWGATHPALGFYGFQQDKANIVQVDLPCRPCSVFGNEPCIFQGQDEFKCLKNITEDVIVEKIESLLTPQ